jgi:flavodoxin
MKIRGTVATVVMIAVCLLLCGGVCSAAEESAQGKTLILYYSRSGNTRAACEALQKELGADIQEIQDLNSRKGFWAGTGMLKIFMGMQTDIEPATVDFSPYDRIIVSAPIWAAQFGLAMRTFVERSSFAEKDVIIFITADSFIEEKYQQKHKDLVAASKGRVAGYFQVQATDLVNGEKVPRTKEKIVEDTLKLVPAIKACITGKN